MSTRLPKYQIEVIAFAYHDFDPTEERFVEVPRGSLLDLLNPSLLETSERHEPVVSRQLMQQLRRVDGDAPTLIPTEPGPDTSWLDVLEEDPVRPGSTRSGRRLPRDTRSFHDGRRHQRGSVCGREHDG